MADLKALAEVIIKGDQIAAVNLTKSWMNQFQIPKEDVVRHSDVSGDSVRGDGKGKVDPGNGFDWKRFIESI